MSTMSPNDPALTSSAKRPAATTSVIRIVAHGMSDATLERGAGGLGRGGCQVTGEAGGGTSGVLRRVGRVPLAGTGVGRLFAGSAAIVVAIGSIASGGG